MTHSTEQGTYTYLDTTGRDGDQAQPYENQFKPGAKPGWAEESAQLGMSTIEAGFPATPADTEEVAEVARTVGCREYIDKLFSTVTRWVIEGGYQNSVTISTHCHNDIGMATANTLSAIEAVGETAREMGARTPNVQSEVVWGGRGERAGNASAEQVIIASQMHADELEGLVMPRVDITRIMRVAEHVYAALDMEIPPTAPIIGKDTLTHRSGIHAAAILKVGARAYAPFDPRWVGHSEAAIIAAGGYQGTRGNNNLGAMHRY